MRMHGHGAHDDASYVPPALFAHWAARDPLTRQRERLAPLGVDVDAIDAAVRAEIELATAEALAMAEPVPGDPLAGVFCEGEPPIVGRGAAPWSRFAGT